MYAYQNRARIQRILYHRYGCVIGARRTSEQMHCAIEHRERKRKRKNTNNIYVYIENRSDIKHKLFLCKNSNYLFKIIQLNQNLDTRFPCNLNKAIDDVRFVCAHWTSAKSKLNNLVMNGFLVLRFAAFFSNKNDTLVILLQSFSMTGKNAFAFALALCCAIQCTSLVITKPNPATSITTWPLK